MKIFMDEFLFDNQVVYVGRFKCVLFFERFLIKRFVFRVAFLQTSYECLKLGCKLGFACFVYPS